MKNFRIQVIGIGRAGISILKHINVNTLQDVSIIDTDISTFEILPDNIHKILLGHEISFGLGTFGETEIGLEISKKEQNTITSLLENSDMIFLITGLGGGTGSILSQSFAEIASKNGTKVFTIAILPFEFQGERIRKISYDALQNLKLNSNVIISLKNDDLFCENQLSENLDKSKFCRNRLEDVNSLIANAIESFAKTIKSQNFFKGSENTLFSFIERAKNEQCIFMSGSGEGENAFQNAIDKLNKCSFFSMQNSWKLIDVIVILRLSKDWESQEISNCFDKILHNFTIHNNCSFSIDYFESKNDQNQKECEKMKIDIHFWAILKECNSLQEKYALYDSFEDEKNDSKQNDLIISKRRNFLKYEEYKMNEIDLEIPTYIRMNENLNAN